MMTDSRIKPPGLAMRWYDLKPKLLYLASGSILTLYSQWLYNQRAIDTSTHLLAWTKYCFVFISSSILYSSRSSESRSTPPAQLSVSGSLLLLFCGLLDVCSYALACMGFACCGTLLSTTVSAASSHICNAVMSSFVMHRRLPLGRKIALAIVTLGMCLRSLDSWGGARMGTEWSQETWLGAAYVFASALGYSLLGVLYEWMIHSNPTMTHFQYQRSAALIGVLGTTAYQIAYTLPNWKELVVETVVDSSLDAWQVVLSLVVFGGLFNFNSYFQAFLFKQEDGALGVGVVTAVRGATVSVLSGLIFCSQVAPGQCLTFWRGCSAFVVSAGGVAWTLHPPARSPTSGRSLGGSTMVESSSRRAEQFPAEKQKHV